MGLRCDAHSQDRINGRPALTVAKIKNELVFGRMALGSIARGNKFEMSGDGGDYSRWLMLVVKAVLEGGRALASLPNNQYSY